MRCLHYIKTGVLWAIAFYLLWCVGTFYAFPLLRGAELRDMHTPLDWVDSAIGIFSLLLIAGFFLVLRLRLASVLRAAQHGAAADDRPQAGDRG